MSDKKVSQLPSLTTAAAPDLLMIVDDPNGTPTSKKITVKNLFGAVPSNTQISGHVTPSANVTYDLGSPAKAWRSLYVSNNTIYIGGKALTVAQNGSVLVDGEPISAGGGTTYPTPSIAYTGVFGQLPTYWRYTGAPPKLQYTSNGAFRTAGSDYYFLDQNFDDGNYDLSGTTTLSFNNIGGIKGYFDMSAKSEVVLTSLDLGEIAVVDEWFTMAGFSNTLTSFTASNLADVGQNFEIYGMTFTNGPTMEFPALDRIGGTLYIDYNRYNFYNTPAPAFPALRYTQNVYIYYNRYSSWSNFTTLHEIVGQLEFRNNDTNENEPWVAPGFPSLATVGAALDIHGNDDMVTIPAFTSLTRVAQNINIYSNNSLTALPAFPALTYCANLYCENNPMMTTVGDSFMPSLRFIDGEVNFRGCQLDQASIDRILVRLASLDGTGQTQSYEYRNIYLDQPENAIPSEAGLAAKSTLEGRGCNVYVNS
jgi:hypothetical protein